MELFGFDIDRTHYSPGDILSLTMYYRATRDMDHRYTAFIHLLGPGDGTSSGLLRAQNDSEPCHGFFPTSSWVPGEIIADKIKVRIPDEAPAGGYTLATGFYETGTGERLGASGSSVVGHDIVRLAEIEIDRGPGS